MSIEGKSNKPMRFSVSLSGSRTRSQTSLRTERRNSIWPSWGLATGTRYGLRGYLMAEYKGLA